MTLEECFEPLPPGAIRTWDDFKRVADDDLQFIYMVIVNNNTIVSKKATYPLAELIQFNTKENKLEVKDFGFFLADGLKIRQIANRERFNARELANYFVFTNYFLAFGFTQKLEAAGVKVTVQKNMKLETPQK